MKPFACCHTTYMNASLVMILAGVHKPQYPKALVLTHRAYLTDMCWWTLRMSEKFWMIFTNPKFDAVLSIGTMFTRAYHYKRE